MIVGSLVKLLDEEQAFWTLVQISECYLPLDYYSNLFGIMIDMQIFEDLLNIHCKETIDHINECFFPLLLILNWFVTLLQSEVKPETSVFILTAYLLRGH